MSTRYYKIVSGGMGSFLCPPGHPNHTRHVMEKAGNHREVGSMAIDSATRYDYLPEAIRDRAQRLIDNATMVESDLWVRSVYGYFRNMWTADGRMWERADNLNVGRPDGAPDDWHAAPLYIRQYFPDHAVRADLIASPGKGYGSYPCDKCGTAVQYEPSADKLAPYGGTPECPEGGDHVVTDGV